MTVHDAQTRHLRVQPDTRNHRGCFVQEMTYELIEIGKTGWALICDDHDTCHYVDPECLKETKRSKKRHLVTA